MKKGLRQMVWRILAAIDALNSCPDEEGIKTRETDQVLPVQRSLNSCPDEEGIKTR